MIWHVRWWYWRCAAFITFDTDATRRRCVTHQNITYKYDAGSAPPVHQPHVAFRLFDGDGGASLPASTTVTIQPAAPAVALSLTDCEPSVTLLESAAQLGVVLDESVQLVPARRIPYSSDCFYVSNSGPSGRPAVHP